MTSGSASQPSAEECRKAWAYCRFSTVAQAEGDSSRRQRDNARDWCEKNGHEISYLEDHGVSAFRGRNRTVGQFADFVAAVRGKQLGPTPLLLIENFDRMSREAIEEAQVLFLQLIAAGAVIVTLHNGKQYKRGMGLVDIITALVEMDLAHQYSERLSERVRAAINERRKSGMITHTASSSPRWLELNEDRTAFSHRPARVVLVREIFQRAGKGQGAAAIARAFNVRKEPTWTNAAVWQGTTIRNLLHDRAVLGEFEGRDGYFGKPVVTTEQWAAVNEGSARKAQGRGKGVIKEQNLFAGFIYSGLDGSSMILRTSGVKRRDGTYAWHNYLVSSLTLAGVAKEPHRVKYSVIEERTLVFFDSESMERATRNIENDISDRVTAAKERVAGLDGQVKKLTKLILNDDHPSSSLVAQLKRHERELIEAVIALESLNALAARETVVRAMPSRAELLRPEVRRAVRKELARLFVKIDVHRDFVLCWADDRSAYGIYLDPAKKGFFHDLDGRIFAA